MTHSQPQGFLAVPLAGKAYNQSAAGLAWDRTLAFLKHSSTL